MSELSQKRARDSERVDRVCQALKKAEIDALVCALPAYVLMLTGYWPVVGTAIAVFSREGKSVVLAPEDEKDLAQQGWADEVRCFEPSQLDRIQTPIDAAADPLRGILQGLGLVCRRLGYEYGPASEPASYAGMNLYKGSMVELLRRVAPSAPLAPADELLAELAATKTAIEVDYIRRACRVAQRAFDFGRQHLHPGMSETEAAALVRGSLSIASTEHEGIARGDGFAWCMSGPNSFHAKAAYARSRARQINAGEFVLMHCNSYADGYWTDVTRTYVIGEPDQRQRRMYDAVFAAREAAFAAIVPGAAASQVDRAARDVLQSHGFGQKEFPHPTGHGVGFAAISANARPRIHPRSEEILEPRMVFNIEPAIYIEGVGGIRHCDLVAVTSRGMELLTDFQSTTADLLLPLRQSPVRLAG